MNRAERRRRRSVRCPRNRQHRVLVHVNTNDPTQAVWNCPACEIVGTVAIDADQRLHAVRPEPMTDYDRMAWARLAAGLLGTQEASA